MVTDSARARSSKELSRRQVLYRVSRSQSFSGWPSLGTGGLCDLILTFLLCRVEFVCMCLEGLGLTIMAIMGFCRQNLVIEGS